MTAARTPDCVFLRPDGTLGTVALAMSPTPLHAPSTILAGLIRHATRTRQDHGIRSPVFGQRPDGGLRVVSAELDPAIYATRRVPPRVVGAFLSDMIVLLETAPACRGHFTIDPATVVDLVAWAASAMYVQPGSADPHPTPRLAVVRHNNTAARIIAVEAAVPTPVLATLVDHGCSAAETLARAAYPAEDGIPRDPIQAVAGLGRPYPIRANPRRATDPAEPTCVPEADPVAYQAYMDSARAVADAIFAAALRAAENVETHGDGPVRITPHPTATHHVQHDASIVDHEGIVRAAWPYALVAALVRGAQLEDVYAILHALVAPRIAYHIAIARAALRGRPFPGFFTPLIDKLSSVTVQEAIAARIVGLASAPLTPADAISEVDTIVAVATFSAVNCQQGDAAPRVVDAITLAGTRDLPLLRTIHPALGVWLTAPVLVDTVAAAGIAPIAACARAAAALRENWPCGTPQWPEPDGAAALRIRDAAAKPCAPAPPPQAQPPPPAHKEPARKNPPLAGVALYKPPARRAPPGPQPQHVRKTRLGNLGAIATFAARRAEYATAADAIKKSRPMLRGSVEGDLLDEAVAMLCRRDCDAVLAVHHRITRNPRHTIGNIAVRTVLYDLYVALLATAMRTPHRYLAQHATVADPVWRLIFYVRQAAYMAARRIEDIAHNSRETLVHGVAMHLADGVPNPTYFARVVFTTLVSAPAALAYTLGVTGTPHCNVDSHPAWVGPDGMEGALWRSITSASPGTLDIGQRPDTRRAVQGAYNTLAEDLGG